MSFASSEIIWLRRLLQELGVPVIGPTSLNADNTSAIQIANNHVFHERTKHIEVNCHFIRQHVLFGLLKLPHVSLQDQLADILTKSLPRMQHDSFTVKLMLPPSRPQFERG